MSFILAASLLLFGDPSVSVSTTDGSELSGTLINLTAEAIELQVGPGATVQAVKIEKLKRLRFTRSNGSESNGSASDLSNPGTQISATLTDGSRLIAHSIRSDGQTLALSGVVLAAIDDTRDGPLMLPRSLLRSIQLLPLPTAQAAQFDQFCNSKVTADQAVIQRSNRPLQTVEGAIGEIDEQIVKFLFDGDWVEVKRPRIAGLVFYRPTEQPALTAKCALTLHDGSQLEVNAIQFEQNRLLVTVASGAQWAVPIRVVERIDYPSGEVVYLSDLEPERWQYASQLEIKSLTSLEDRWFRPQANRTLMGQPLSVTTTFGETTYQKGLGIHSRTELVYRLAGEYRRFSATAALDQLQNVSEATIVVHTDETEQFRETIRTGESVEIDVNLSAANRLRITIEPADDSELCDHVNLCDARISK